jgi:hypothetical protein
MKRATGETRAATFVVRLWQEPRQSPAADAVWRGTAVHVQTGAERGIKGLDELVRFMQSWLEENAPAPGSSSEG